jgi:two-component system sensor histidine kinase/response regulator
MHAGIVLVIDDNAENRALAKAALEDDGYHIELATSGEEGIAAYARVRPDCVLLDIRMPGLDGIATCRKLRELGADVPILFFTAQRDVDTFDRAREAGGDDFLMKPVRPTELVTRVAAAVRMRRLASERSELYEVVRRQRDDLMRLQLHKEQVIGFLVHDLKNPVNAIELQAQRIVRDPSANGRARDATARIRDEARSLMRMILNLLDLSRGDEDRLGVNVETIEVSRLVGGVVESMRGRAQAVGVEIEAPTGSLAMRADADLVRRMLENLTDNAIRHAPEGTRIELSAVRADGAVVLRVADHGPGIPEAERARVFERFEQGVGRGSHGLGLAFCKLVAETHHGRIWIEDANPGAVFCVRGPVAPECPPLVPGGARGSPRRYRRLRSARRRPARQRPGRTHVRISA